MKNALLLHGTFDNSQSNWLPWLKEQLENRGYKVWVPDLPGADKPNLERYNKFIFSNWQFDVDSVLIGHSSGAVAILGILQNLPSDVVVKKAILVAGFKDDLDWEPLKEINFDFDWDKIKARCKKIILIHSDDDPFVPVDQGEFLKEKLGAEMRILKGQQHFSISTMGDGYFQFPPILELIG